MTTPTVPPGTNPADADRAAFIAASNPQHADTQDLVQAVLGQSPVNSANALQASIDALSAKIDALSARLDADFLTTTP